jgi:enoyl-CoA hydratase/carnithine racemase
MRRERCDHAQHAGDDAAEGVGAFIEKRKPRWNT